MTNNPKVHDECYACPVGSFFVGLQDAQPDATEHLLLAAQELLNVARSAIDVADRALEHQRSGREQRRSQTSRVRRIDIV